MRHVTLVLAAAAIVGCSTTPVMLRHPRTGQTVQCGPYSWNEMRTGNVTERERGCIEDFRRQGYERIGN